MFKRRQSGKKSSTTTSKRNGSGTSVNSAGSPSAVQLKSCLKASENDYSFGKYSNPTMMSSGADESVHSSNNNNINIKKRVSVSFDAVHIREYERIIGDNPSCSTGAPIGIGWAHSETKAFPVEDFETVRCEQRSKQDALVLNRQLREELLLEWGASFQDIVEAIRNNVRVKNQRRRTVNNLGTYDRWEEVMESASRKLKRTLLLKKPTRGTSFSKKGSDDGSSHSESTPSHDHQSVNSRGSIRPPQFKNVPDVERAPQMSAEEAIAAAEARGRAMAEMQEEALDPLQQDNRRLASNVMELGRQAMLIPDDDELWNDSAYDGMTVTSGITFDPGMEDEDVDDVEDEYDRIWRDEAHWRVARMQPSPFMTQRKMSPVVISEDGVYDMEDYDRWDNGGFTMQPPPYSDNIISRWE